MMIAHQAALQFELDEADTKVLAADMAAICQIGDCLCLNGDLGAGKSTFARAFIRALAGDTQEALEVPSPTFTLVQTYRGRVPAAHFDLYRLGDPQELEELGLDEALESGIALIEWPQRGGDLLPKDAVQIDFSIPANNTERRLIRLAGSPRFMARIQRSLSIRTLLQSVGWGKAHRAPLMADASVRGYEIAQMNGDERIIMDAPTTPDGPPIRDGKPYSRLAHLAENVSAFIAIANLLRAKGFNAPEIYAHNLDAGLVLLGHLGSGSVLDQTRKPIADHYILAAQLLADMHAVTWPAIAPVTENQTHIIAAYDLDVFIIEADLLADWYVPYKSSNPLSDKDRQTYHALLADLHSRLDWNHSTLVLRDYHSPNIIVCDGQTPAERVGLIDFQDALIGPCAYDVMSLAEDARIDLPDDLRRSILAAYIDRRIQADIGFDRRQFEREAAIVAAQRALKILGIFVRLDRRDGKPAYLAHLPRVQAALERALQHPDLAALRQFLSQRGVL